ncbi:hypothetical protein FF021_19865 [Leptospira noguchii]|uniref:Uncharacterized protein n=1 Tax=Leptospira noguchii str. 2001034031 TaxID=1193053 RepID=M6YDX3_9LEPT|nr:hypothetical protein LEP1GSC024_3657 [Leptospira noguchii str. 2001034031]TQE64304.1 hypothetical protein FF021_19865 [Leptospira noguchii]
MILGNLYKNLKEIVVQSNFCIKLLFCSYRKNKKTTLSMRFLLKKIMTFERIKTILKFTTLLYKNQ